MRRRELDTLISYVRRNADSVDPAELTIRVPQQGEPTFCLVDADGDETNFQTTDAFATACK